MVAETPLNGAYTGNSTIGSVQLTGYNLRDAFVAKIDQQGNVLWATTTTDERKLCANDVIGTAGISASSSTVVSLSSPFVATCQRSGCERESHGNTILSCIGLAAGNNTIQVMQNDPNDPNPPLTYADPVGVIELQLDPSLLRSIHSLHIPRGCTKRHINRNYIAGTFLRTTGIPFTIVYS